MFRERVKLTQPQTLSEINSENQIRILGEPHPKI